MPTIKIEGFEQAKRALDQLSKQVRNKLIKSAIKNAAKPMVAMARSNAPRKTGLLKKSIRAAYLRRLKSNPSEVAVGVAIFSTTTKDGDLQKKYGTKKKGKIYPFYARFVHEGAANGISPNPFLATAYESKKEEVINAFGDELGKSIEKYVNKNYKPL